MGNASRNKHIVAKNRERKATETKKKKPLTIKEVAKKVVAPINKDYDKKKEQGQNSNFRKIYSQVES